MIFVDRRAVPRIDLFDPVTKVPVRLNFDLNDSAGAKERDKAIQHFLDTGEPPEASSFKAYSHQDIRTALEILFHGKCAYCESQISGSSQVDIEHYRPKGGVKDAETAQVNHPGYWWLAMDWDNLVLSCMHCNQSRRQLIFDKDMTEAELHAAIEKDDRSTRGKKNSFPTEDNTWVLEHTKDIADEKPLLIDPTVTDPADHFEWDFKGVKLCSILAKDGSLQGQTTIDVLGLNRWHLSEDRARKLRKLVSLADDVDWALRKVDRASSDSHAADLIASAIRSVDKIANEAEADQPYSALADAYLARIEAKVVDALAPS